MIYDTMCAMACYVIYEMMHAMMHDMIYDMIYVMSCHAMSCYVILGGTFVTPKYGTIMVPYGTIWYHMYHVVQYGTIW